MTPALSDIIARLSSAGRITADDVLSLRAEIYGADSLAPDAMEALAGLEAASGDRDPAWGDFLSEAVVDFVVHQEDPPDYVDDAKCDWVIRIFTGDVRPDAGLQTLARILEAATEVPPRLASFAVKKARDSLCAKGRVSAEDVAVLRRLVYAGASEGDLGVSREEAAALFAIDNATRGAFNDAAWADFFAQAVGAALLAASPYTPESREAALADEAWLDHKDTLGEFAAQMFAKPDLKGAIHEILHPDDDAQNEWTSAEAKVEADEADAGRITDDDARWLVGQLSQGPLSAPERRLLAFLGAEASEVSDLLKPLLAAAAPGAMLAPPVASEDADGRLRSASAPRSKAAPAVGGVEPATVFGLRRTPAA
ncbi:MAG TPA: hypothetical protein VME40_08145 [Caulobacteraceae bacterium]|nr:hypothetical protein [Caulobacteraceae bacterium]